MLILSGLGLIHARRTAPATEILSGHPAGTPDPAPAAHNGHLAAATPASSDTP